MATLRLVPPYGKRQGWVPKDASDFGNGGAFPEISLLQYPLGLGEEGGRKSHSSKALVLQTDAQGRPTYEAILTQNSCRNITFSRPEHYRPTWSDAADLQKPSEEEQAKLTEETAKALAEISKVKQSMNQLTRAADSIKKKDQFIRYMPDTAAPGYTPHCAERIIRVVEKKIDPLEPSKFRVRRAPAGNFEPPPPLLRAPAKKLTAEDHAAWNLPPCVSNWKNQKGYTIPLDMRLQADGRGLEEVSINSKFAQFSEALYVAERLAREEIRLKNDLLKQKKQLEEAHREEMLREIAAKARQERVQRLTGNQTEAPPVISPKQSRSPSPSPTKHVKRSRTNSQDSNSLRKSDDVHAATSSTQQKEGRFQSTDPRRHHNRPRSPSLSNRRQVSPQKTRMTEVKDAESKEDNRPTSKASRQRDSSEGRHNVVSSPSHRNPLSQRQVNPYDELKVSNRSPSPSDTADRKHRSSPNGGRRSPERRNIRSESEDSSGERRRLWNRDSRHESTSERRRPITPPERRRGFSPPNGRGESSPPNGRGESSPPNGRRHFRTEDHFSTERRREDSQEREAGRSPRRRDFRSGSFGDDWKTSKRGSRYEHLERRNAGRSRRSIMHEGEEARRYDGRERGTEYENGRGRERGTEYENGRGRERGTEYENGRGRERGTEYENGRGRGRYAEEESRTSSRIDRNGRRESESLSDEEIPSTHHVDDRRRRRRRSSSSERSRSSAGRVKNEQAEGHYGGSVAKAPEEATTWSEKKKEVNHRRLEEGKSPVNSSKRQRGREDSKRSLEELNPLQAKVKQLERERRKEIEREFRLERAGRKRVRTDADRDVSERIALGQAQATSQDAMYDTRLFNREGGGPDITVADADDYALYDRPLFADKSESGGGLYRMDKERIRKNVGLRTVTAIGDRPEGREDQPVKFERAEPGAR